jgi:MFS family permease
MLFSAVALAVLTLLGWVTPAVLLVLTFSLGLGTALNGPAWQAIMPELVPRPELPQAVSLNSVAFNIARAVGPALGGLVVAAAGSWAVFLLELPFLRGHHPGSLSLAQGKGREHLSDGACGGSYASGLALCAPFA